MSLAAVGQDAARKELDRAKAAYQAEKQAYRIRVLKDYDKQQDTARKAGDKKLIDQLK